MSVTEVKLPSILSMSFYELTFYIELASVVSVRCFLQLKIIMLPHLGWIAFWTLALVLAVAASAVLIAAAYIHYVHLKYRHIPGPPRTRYVV